MWIILLRFEAIFGFKVYYQKKDEVTEQNGPSLYSIPPPPTLFCAWGACVGFNRLSPNIHIQILETDLYTFS